MIKTINERKVITEVVDTKTKKEFAEFLTKYLRKFFLQYETNMDVFVSEFISDPKLEENDIQIIKKELELMLLKAKVIL